MRVQSEVRACRERYELLKVKSQFEDVPETEVTNAADELLAAETRLRAVESSTSLTGDSETVRYLMDQVERLGGLEMEENLKRYKPLYIEAMKAFDKALSKAAEASMAIHELREQGGPIPVSWPGEWSELNGQNISSRLYLWREKAKKFGLLK